jgi:hypothetical protein
MVPVMPVLWLFFHLYDKTTHRMRYGQRDKDLFDMFFNINQQFHFNGTEWRDSGSEGWAGCLDMI